MYAKGNVRRENEFQLCKPALAKAGFNLIDAGTTRLGRRSSATARTTPCSSAGSRPPPAVSADQAILRHRWSNNLIGYTNKEVDEPVRRAGRHRPTRPSSSSSRREIEKLLFEDAIGITIFQFPSATISNKDPGRRTSTRRMLAPTMFYGFWDWKVPGS